MAEEPEVRTLIPSARQLQHGAPRPRYADRHRELGSSSRATLNLRSLLSELSPGSIEGAKLPLVLLGLSALFASWDDVALRVLLPEMRAEFGLNLQFLLTLASTLGVVTIVIAPATGYLADRVKRVWMIRAGGLIANAASLVQGLAPGVSQLVAGRALAGLGGSLTAPAAFPLLTDYYPSRARARVFAFLGFMAGLGGVVAPAVAGNLGEFIGWRAAVVLLGALALVVTTGFFFLKEPVRGLHDRLDMGADQRMAAKEQPAVSWAEAWRAARSITTLRRLWYATPFIQVAIVGFGVFVAQYFAEEFALGPQARGYIAAAQGVVALGGILIAAPLSDRLLSYRPGRVLVAISGLMVVYAVSVAVLALSTNLWLSIVVGMPLAFGFVALSPALNTLISLVVPARIRGLGLQTIAPWQLAGMLILPFIGRAADSWGLRQGLLTFIPVYLIGAIILGSSSLGVDRDMRAARAASMAGLAARRSQRAGRSKMLVCRGVDVHYEGTQVLFNVDFDVEEGESVALLGTNGAGKSTLLKAIAGIQEASNGAIFFNGQDTTHVPPHENAQGGIVVAPGGRAIFPGLTVAENLELASWLHRDRREEVNESRAAVLECFPALRSRLGQPAGTLSGGEQQMLGLAQALMVRPKLMLIDELSLGLAPSVIAALVEILRRIRAQGTTLVIAEQSLKVAEMVAGRAVFMEKGEIRFDGSIQELRGRPELLRPTLVGRASSSAGRLSSPRQISDSSEGSFLAVVDASVEFGGIRALDRVSMKAAVGEVVGLIGPNGAGKTTLFNFICGFVEPKDGHLFLDGKDAGPLTPSARARRGLARSFQDVSLFPSMTVRENLMVATERRLPPLNLAAAAVWTGGAKVNETRARRRAEELIDLLGLEASADKFVDELSTGTRRAVDVGCLMAAEPKMLLLDEPSSGLAEAETDQIAPLIRRLVRETGCGVVLIEHHLGLVTSVSDRLIAMDLGKVIAEGAPQQVMQDPTVLESYLSASSFDSTTAVADGGAAPSTRRLKVR